MKYPEIAKLGLWKKFGIFKENERLRQQVEDLHEVVQKQIYANTELRQQNAELVEALQAIAIENDNPECCGFGVAVSFSALECCGQPKYGFDRCVRIAQVAIAKSTGAE